MPRDERAGEGDCRSGGWVVEIGGGGCFSVCNVGRIEVKSVTLR